MATMQASDLKTAIEKADKSTLVALVDGFFAGLVTRADAITNPAWKTAAVLGLETANYIIDKVMERYGI